MPTVLQKELIGLIPTLAGKRVLVIGDLMLDAYLFGDAERLSPEAPVPVVAIAEERYFLGGAGNVARNIAALGGLPCLIGQVGIDSEAAKLRALLEKHGIAFELAESSSRPTTVKTRVLARGQQMVRLDKENAAPFTQDETKTMLAAVEKHVQGYDVIVLSDYAKGFMSQMFMQGLHSCLAQKRHSPLVLVDPKPGNINCYHGVDLLTPNAKETGECAGLPARTKEEILAAGKAILESTQSPHLLTTLGPNGMALFTSGEKVWHIPTVARDVFDVTGAGDTVIATLALSLAAGNDLLDSCKLANYAAGFVVGRVGTATVSPSDLEHVVRTLPPPKISQWA
ncbi:MAG: D-glycero-beta-D-manno-heptose-7-phosphate kinase [Desulfovibrionaceae bacterium]|nr:D-glycero-beta-D-manno-heptose-7-phosphate kinase [Desulfovibrionaceae bacterium]